MTRWLFAGIFIAAVAHPAGVALSAQTQPALSQSADVARLRTEKAVGRQRRALEGMAESIASQRRSVERQTRYWQSRNVFALPPVIRFTPAEAVPCDALPAARIDALVNGAARSTSVAPELIRSVMWQESGFRPCAVSAKGAMGLMQLVPGTASDLGVTDVFNLEANVLGGARLLKQLLDHYGGDLRLTLSAYNAGAGKVDALMSVPTIPETIDYVNRILSRLSSANLLQPANQPEKAATAEETDGQSALDSAPDISLRLTGSEGDK
jgi:soluble lytic murein transglycosylase-like protein